MPRAIDVEKRWPAPAGSFGLGGSEPMGLETQPQPRGSAPAWAESRAASPLPEAQALAPAVPAPDLPPIAAKADDLEAIKKAVDDAASVGGGLWLSYLFVLFYLAVAAGAVTHEDLFFERPVKLPFLGIELPLVAFFALAPLIFVVVHAYTLVHLVFLTDKASHYHRTIYDQMGDKDGLSKEELDERKAKRDGLRRQLPSNIFIQFLAGPSNVRESGFGWLLQGIAWITLAVAPVLLLLLMQIQFLPYHSEAVIWTQRVALGLDLTLTFWLWRRILSGREIDRVRRIFTWLALPLRFTLSVAVLLLSVTVVTFPGEWQETRLPSWPILPAMAEWRRPATEKGAEGNHMTASILHWAVSAKRMSLHDWLFDEEPDPTTRRRMPFSNTLVLPGLNIYEGLGVDDPEKAKWRDFVFRARGRDLKGAIFDLTVLPKVDFEGADLEGAAFHNAQLQGASLEGALLQGAALERAQLQGASLQDAELRGARLDDAQLQGASFSAAHLQGASLIGAHLQGASLQSADLQGAWVTFAQLQGASLDRAYLQGADLDNAEAQGASLMGAHLQGASFNNAHLQGASLQTAELQGASLDGAELQGASLTAAELQGALLQRAVLEATDLSESWLWRTNARARADIRKPAAVWLSEASWEPSWRHLVILTWDEENYRELLAFFDPVPPGELRGYALERVTRLDCSNPDKTLASCDSDLAATLPPEAIAWRTALEAASVDAKTYTTALTKTLKELVCSGGSDAVHVVRGKGFQNRLQDAGLAAASLVGNLTAKDSKDCPVSTMLSDADRANLLQIKQGIEKVGK
jgi:uncharacterized protein YjbI with pentapeptide repeats